MNSKKNVFQAVDDLKIMMGRLFFDNETFENIIVDTTRKLKGYYKCLDIPLTEIQVINLWIFYHVSNSVFSGHFFNRIFELFDHDHNINTVRCINTTPLYMKQSVIYNLLCDMNKKILMGLQSFVETEPHSFIRPSLLYTYEEVREVFQEYLNPVCYRYLKDRKRSLLSPILVCHIYEMFFSGSWEEFYLTETKGDMNNMSEYFDYCIQKHGESMLFPTYEDLYNDMCDLSDIHQKLSTDSVKVKLLKRYVGIGRNEDCLLQMISLEARVKTLFFLLYRELFCFKTADELR